ncbi:Divinyl chlorophyllide a 8-vinyl-reductase, chloroplastic, partial [Cucurbita argyrosperma subsp. sororia]
MSLCSSAGGGGFNLLSPVNRSDSTRFCSQFVYQIPVSSFSLSFRSSCLRLSETPKSSRERRNPIVKSIQSSFRAKDPNDINILVVGSTGYIGNFVVKELVSRGFNVISIARENSGIRGDLDVPIDVVVSCLASRTGGVKDSWKIDYEATKNSLVAGRNRAPP